MGSVWSRYFFSPARVLLILGSLIAAVTASPASPQTIQAPSAEAIAASLSQGSSGPSQLTHVEEWGLLGKLIGHRFYTTSKNEIVPFDFAVLDKNTISWSYKGSTPVGIRRIGKNRFLHLIFSDGQIHKYPEDTVILNDYSFTIKHTSRYSLDEEGNLDIVLYEEFSDRTEEIRVKYYFDTKMSNGKALHQELVSVKASYPIQLSQVRNDIKNKCPGDKSNVNPNSDLDCYVVLQTERDIRKNMGEDTSNDMITRRERQVAEERAAKQEQIAQQNQAMMSQAIQQYAVGANAIAQARGARRSTPARSNVTNDYSAANNAQQTRSTEFGALPGGVGTPSQRQFWADKCANLPNDGSSAAQGCQQTRQMLHLQPVASPPTGSAARFPVGGVTTSGSVSPTIGDYGAGTSIGGLSSDKPELHAEQCISATPGHSASFHNRCAFEVAVTFCVTNPSEPNALSCSGNGGGSDTIEAGGDTMTAAQLYNPDHRGPFGFRFAACRGGLGNIPVLRQQGINGICS